MASLVVVGLGYHGQQGYTGEGCVSGTVAGGNGKDLRVYLQTPWIPESTLCDTQRVPPR